MGSLDCVFSSDDIVVKPPNDKRLYRTIELHNGLCALLIHDPEIYPAGPPCDSNSEDEEEEEDEEEGRFEDGVGGEEEEEEEDDDDDDDGEHEEDGDTGLEYGENGVIQPTGKGVCSQTKKAAAAMCVGMGSFSDPLEAQGLAHFLEHMLFMGSKDFPDENEYDSYLSKHGGSSNAYTETEHTCYHFEVKREHLRGALKRFSKFFVCPLVKSEAMEREVLAVDSGNKKSLVEAMERGLDLRNQILKLYQKYYHGGLMKLVVIGGEPLDVLQSWVIELFSDVRRGPQIRPEFKGEGTVWKTGKVYRLQAVKDVHILDLTWTLPCLLQHYLKKPEDYLAHLLGHEGRGSLHYFLKAKGWITSLSAGIGDEGLHRSSVAYIFGLSIHLTDSGLEKIFDIIGYVYQYIKLLRQVPPQEWIFRELQDIGNMDFRFAEEEPQDDYAAELAENMLIYPKEHVIYGDFLYKDWDEVMIKHILDFFTPDNMRVDVVSKSIDSQGFLIEPWFGSFYTEEDVAQSFITLYRDPSEVDVSLHLPIKNEFIPNDFSIRADNVGFSPAEVPTPVCISDEPIIKLWYKLDRTFKLPRANTYFRINLKGAYASLKCCILTELYIHLLKDELNEIIYQASVAKLETSVSFSGDKLELKLYGFNDKLPSLLSKVLETAKSFMPRSDRFEVIKENMERTLRNTNMKPLSQSSYMRLQVLCETFYDVDEKLCSLKDLTLGDLKAFIPELLSQIYIEGLCHGNLLEAEAIKMRNSFSNNFSVIPLPPTLRHGERVICLPLGCNMVRDVRVKNKSETNSVVELYFQVEPEVGEQAIRLKALMDLFDEIVDEPFFNQLRTKEQLGYVVQCGPRVTYRVYGFCFCVQSSEYDPLYLLERIDHFINSVEELLNGLDDHSFENYRSGLMAKLLEKDPSLPYETNRYWNQIVDKRYVFDFSEKEAAEVGNLKKTDVLNWYKTYLQKLSPKCRRFAVRVWGCNTDMKEAGSKGAALQFIDELAPFKKLSNYYTSFC